MRVRLCVLPYSAPSWSLRLENDVSQAPEMRRSPSLPQISLLFPWVFDLEFQFLTVLLKATGRADSSILVSPPIHSVQMTHPAVQSTPSPRGLMPSGSGTSCTTWTSWHRCLWRRKSTWATLLRSCWSPASLMGSPVMPGQEGKAALAAPRTSGSECWAPCVHLKLN